jgi:hypothetical protein
MDFSLKLMDIDAIPMEKCPLRIATTSKKH